MKKILFKNLGTSLLPGCCINHSFQMKMKNDFHYFIAQQMYVVINNYARKCEIILASIYKLFAWCSHRPLHRSLALSLRSTYNWRNTASHRHTPPYWWGMVSYMSSSSPSPSSSSSGSCMIARETWPRPIVTSYGNRLRPRKNWLKWTIKLNMIHPKENLTILLTR